MPDEGFDIDDLSNTDLVVEAHKRGMILVFEAETSDGLRVFAIGPRRTEELLREGEIATDCYVCGRQIVHRHSGNDITGATCPDHSFVERIGRWRH